MNYTGTVVKGQELGRKLGFPTANVKIDGNPPGNGVWVVDVEGLGRGVCNVGRRPTVGGVDLVVEIHLLEFSGELYGRKLEFTLVARLRDEQKFDSLDALKAQISKDVARARGME